MLDIQLVFKLLKLFSDMSLKLKNLSRASRACEALRDIAYKLNTPEMMVISYR